MNKINIDTTKASSFSPTKQYNGVYDRTLKAFKLLYDNTGKGKEFLEWMNLPFYKEEDIVMMEETLDHFTRKIDTIVVLGIGGSYMGAKAMIEALSKNFQIEPKREIIFAGFQLDPDYHFELMEYLKEKDFGLIVISKSGSTLETAIGYRMFMKFMVKQIGKVKTQKRILVITDERKGVLREIAGMNDNYTFVIPENVGGRYSVLSPVGLVPIMLAGFSVRNLLRGAQDFSTSTRGTKNNPILNYVATRNALFEFGRSVELIVGFNPKLKYFFEWWKQLFGESEGKNGRGVFPASALFTTDLHSLGQYIQEGTPLLFETIINIEKPKHTPKILEVKDNLDYLNFLSNKTLTEINNIALEGVIEAHYKGGVPIIRIDMEELNEYFLGQLIYFFELSAAVSAYTQGLNPFDQPGVEAYKKNIFRLLKKPGY